MSLSICLLVNLSVVFSAAELSVSRSHSLQVQSHMFTQSQSESRRAINGADLYLSRVYLGS